MLNNNSIISIRIFALVDTKIENYNMVQNCSSKENEINLVKTNQSCWEKGKLTQHNSIITVEIYDSMSAESVTSQYQSDLEENDDSDDVDYIPETDYSDNSILENCSNEVS